MNGNDNPARVTTPLTFATRLVDLLTIVAVGAGLFLLFDHLAWNGSTWDERTDFQIARSIFLQRSIVADVSDPTQGRLPHIIGAVGFWLGGVSLDAFKLPFALTGLASGLLLYAFVALKHGRLVGLHCLAFFLTNPWALASSRTAATGGDALVMLTTFAFLWMAIRICESDRRAPLRSWGQIGALGLLTGIAVGSKLTNAVLLPAGLVLIAVRRRSVVQATAFVLVAGGASLATHPLLLIRADPILAKIRIAWEDTRLSSPRPNASSEPARHNHGRTSLPAVVAESVTAGVAPVAREQVPKLRYLWFTLVGKLTLPFLLVVLAGIAMGIGSAVRTRQLDPAFWGALLFVIAPCAVLAWKIWLNVNYFLPLLLPSITLAAIPLARVLTPSAPRLRLFGSMAWLVLVAFQVSLAMDLDRDFLQAGRRLGPESQGLMSGPAVNHCQGGPTLIDRLNRLRRDGRTFATVHVFETCRPVLDHDAMFGPVAPDGFTFARYTPRAQAQREHLLVVHEVIRYYGYGSPQHAARLRNLGIATTGCRWLNADAPNERFRIWDCPKRP